VIRGATSSFGQAAVNMAVNTGVRVIATTRNRERFGLLEGLGVERVEVEGPELSKRIAETKRIDIVHFYSIQSVRKQSRNDEDPIKVDAPQGPRLFEERSNLFKSINAGMNEEFLECYAPLELNDQMKKRRLREEMANFIIQLLKTKFDSPLQS
jgi:hypothetical protein